MPADPLCHLPGAHTGECIYCRGFSYTDPWWNERCEERVGFERREVLDQPGRIRIQIAKLQKELEAAERAAAVVLEAIHPDLPTVVANPQG